MIDAVRARSPKNFISATSAVFFLFYRVVSTTRPMARRSISNRIATA
jgi:hypothetical protein